MLCRRLVRRVERCNHAQLYFTQVGKVPIAPQPVLPTGQFFIAKNFEYRGVVLFPQKVELVTDDDRNGTQQVG